MNAGGVIALIKALGGGGGGSGGGDSAFKTVEAIDQSLTFSAYSSRGTAKAVYESQISADSVYPIAFKGSITVNNVTAENVLLPYSPDSISLDITVPGLLPVNVSFTTTDEEPYNYCVKVTVYDDGSAPTPPALTGKVTGKLYTWADEYAVLMSN